MGFGIVNLIYGAEKKVDELVDFLEPCYRNK
jgi:hypothetical protein